METLKLSELLTGRPRYIENSKEKNCYDILDSLDIEHQRVEYNFFPKKLDVLELIDKIIGISGIKNLIFKTKNKDFFSSLLCQEQKDLVKKHLEINISYQK